MLNAGERAPEFELRSDRGSTVRLADLRGQKVVLYFYPKDDTPGCTTEACEFRDRVDRFEREGAVVIGVSPDDVDSHRKFREKYDLNFTLLSDPDGSTAKAYGVWGEKKMFGRTYEGVHRTTFLIDEEGRIDKVFESVKPDGHGDEVLRAMGEP